MAGKNCVRVAVERRKRTATTSPYSENARRSYSAGHGADRVLLDQNSEQLWSGSFQLARQCGTRWCSRRWRKSHPWCGDARISEAPCVPRLSRERDSTERLLATPGQGTERRHAHGSNEREREVDQWLDSALRQYGKPTHGRFRDSRPATKAERDRIAAPHAGVALGTALPRWRSWRSWVGHRFARNRRSTASNIDHGTARRVRESRACDRAAQVARPAKEVGAAQAHATVRQRESRDSAELDSSLRRSH